MCTPPAATLRSAPSSFSAGAVLGEIAGGAGLQRARRVLVLAVHRQDEELHARLLDSQALDEVDAREARHGHVEQRHVVVVGLDQRERLVAARRFARHLHVGRRGEDALQAVAHDLVVVGEQHADHCGLPLRRQSHAHAGAAARRTRHLDRAAEVVHPLAHALQAERARLGEVGRRDAAAVVLDLEEDLAVVRAHAHPGLARAGVARDVGERFLQRAVDRRGHRLVDALQLAVARHADLALHAGAAGEVPDQPVGRLGEAEVVEHQRPQVGGDAARGAHGLVEHAAHALGALRRIGVAGGQPLAQPGEVHLQRGEQLPELVVQLARDARLFLLARLEHLRREPPQLFLLRLQRVLRLLAQRDVAQDHRVEVLPGLAGLRDRGLDGELGAVGAHRPQRGRVAHAPAGDAGAAELLDVGVVRGAVALRQEAVQRCADRLLAPHAEDLLGGAIEQHHVLRCVHGDDGVHRRVHDGVQARLALAGAPLGEHHLARRDGDAEADGQHVGDQHRADHPHGLAAAGEGEHVGEQQGAQRGGDRGERRRAVERAAFDRGQSAPPGCIHSAGRCLIPPPSWSSTRSRSASTT